MAAIQCESALISSHGRSTLVEPTEERLKTQPHAQLERLFAQAKEWCVAWGLSRLMRDVSIDFSNEIGARLGVCNPSRMSVTLNGVLLLEQNESILAETLCHELAHIVAALRFGRWNEEHLPEWADNIV